jgi:signal transduction histidine kinase
VTMKRTTWQYWAAASWMVFTVALALWWLLFGLSQARHLGELEGPDAAQVGRVARMLIFEGAALVFMLVAGGVALLAAIRLEQRRRRDLRSFFMAFTHDLKTSLTSLRLQAEAIREDLPQAAANPNLQRMLKDSVRLQLQFENALALTTADGAVFIEAIELRSLVEYLREDFPELTIVLTGDARVRADRRALESVLRNLLQNAVVHGRASRVTLDVRRSTSGAVEIVVTDDGSGSTVDLSTVLDRPFVRPTRTSGSGVGLYVCGRLLQQMKGQIRLIGDRPSGFAVSIELPEAV